MTHEGWDINPDLDLIIALVGKPGTGKTYHARRLAETFDLTYRSVDDVEGRGGFKWIRYTNWMAEQSGVILTESNVVPDTFHRMLNTVESVVFKLNAPTQLRVKRLRERGEGLGRRQRMAKPQIVGHPIDRIFPDGPDQFADLSEAVRLSVEGGRSWL